MIMITWQRWFGPYLYEIVPLYLPHYCVIFRFAIYSSQTKRHLSVRICQFSLKEIFDESKHRKYEWSLQQQQQQQQEKKRKLKTQQQQPK